MFRTEWLAAILDLYNYFGSRPLYGHSKLISNDLLPFKCLSYLFNNPKYVKNVYFPLLWRPSWILQNPQGWHDVTRLIYDLEGLSFQIWYKLSICTSMSGNTKIVQYSAGLYKNSPAERCSIAALWAFFQESMNLALRHIFMFFQTRDRVLDNF